MKARSSFVPSIRSRGSSEAGSTKRMFPSPQRRTRMCGERNRRSTMGVPWRSSVVWRMATGTKELDSVLSSCWSSKSVILAPMAAARTGEEEVWLGSPVGAQATWGDPAEMTGSLATTEVVGWMEMMVTEEEVVSA